MTPKEEKAYWEARKRVKEQQQCRPSLAPHPMGSKKKQVRREIRKVWSEQAISIVWGRTWEHFQKRCAFCGSKQSITRDHFVPLCLGGSIGVENLILLCASCNNTKGDEPVVVAKFR